MAFWHQLHIKVRYGTTSVYFGADINCIANGAGVLTLIPRLGSKNKHTANNSSPPPLAPFNCRLIQLRLNIILPPKQTLCKYLALHRTGRKCFGDIFRRCSPTAPEMERAINFSRLRPSDFAPNNVHRLSWDALPRAVWFAAEWGVRWAAYRHTAGEGYCCGFLYALCALREKLIALTRVCATSAAGKAVNCFSSWEPVGNKGSILSGWRWFRQ